MNYKVLARKYRPQNFQEIVGQETLVETFKNAIQHGRLAHSFLLTGIRGVGKTTTARIIAKSFNCEGNQNKSPTFNICNKCKPCETITNGNCLDVLEIDAASKTGVDNIREVIDSVMYAPNETRFKIYIIDEVHMLSVQAFNALLKTLEEPPEYLKFIFATTEIKKLPVTVVSRCQRFDLSRVKSKELFDFIKKVSEKENGKITEDALKLIVKISEGSVRDALSLLDRALISLEKSSEFDLATAQKIFGCFDKSNLIELFKYILLGEEKKVINIYRLIYNQGIEPKVFLNDFLELLYYFKNISSLKSDSANFSLNDKEFNNIKQISENINNETLLLFWQFTIKTLEEIDIVSNQNLSMEMFLIRLIYLKGMPNISEVISENKNIAETNKDQATNQSLSYDQDLEKDLLDIKNKTIGQIKNVTQEKKLTDHPTLKSPNKTNLQIKTFDDLIKVCNLKKEIKLKYELETNVNLVSFENRRIEISFNNNLDKEFIKNLSTKLYEWTDERWIISLSQKIGQPSQKEKTHISKNQSFEEAKKDEVYKKILELFPDAELIDIKSKNEN